MILSVDNLETKNNVKLFIYKVKARGGDIVLGNTVFDIDNINVDLDNIWIKIYKDSNLKEEIFKTKYYKNIKSNQELIWNVDLSQIQIPKNEEYHIVLSVNVTTRDDTRSLKINTNEGYILKNRVWILKI